MTSHLLPASTIPLARQIRLEAAEARRENLIPASQYHLIAHLTHALELALKPDDEPVTRIIPREQAA